MQIKPGLDESISIALGLLLSIFTSQMVSSCRSTSLDEIQVDLDANNDSGHESAADAGGRGKFRFAVAAMLSPAETHVQYARLAARIGQLLNTPIEMHQRRTYKEINDLLIDGKLDAAWLCTGGYLHLKQRAPAAGALVVPQVAGKTTYNSLIIVAKDSHYQAFQDLAGSVFAFTDPLSNTGCTYPTFRIKRLGKDPEKFFSSTIFTHSHDRSIRAVAHGLVDAAAVDSLVFMQFGLHHADSVSGIRILESSPAFGCPPIVSSPRLPAATRKRLRWVFLRLHEDDQAAGLMKGIGVERFVLPRAGIFDSAREMLSQKAP